MKLKSKPICCYQDTFFDGIVAIGFGNVDEEDLEIFNKIEELNFGTKTFRNFLLNKDNYDADYSERNNTKLLSYVQMGRLYSEKYTNEILNYAKYWIVLRNKQELCFDCLSFIESYKGELEDLYEKEMRFDSDLKQFDAILWAPGLIYSDKF